jgi:acetyl/propionyl-CoA carboxylase alpha subunit/acetyl-CoA carboxylase carboxyltransferase component
MALQAVVVANRGEIAVRVLRTARELGLRSVAVHAADEAGARHASMADEAVALDGSGPGAYLDAEALVRIALDQGCDAIHPGYGFLSERASFARRCAEAGLAFVGPSADTLELFGDKSAARRRAVEVGVPVLEGTAGPTEPDDAAAFMEGLGDGAAVMVKALAGGGGRGMRVVLDPADLAGAMERCASEARSAFGEGAVYVERLVRRARHVEVQVVGDGTGAVAHLGERECSLQRRHQKLVEIAPAPNLDPALRAHMVDAALRLAESTRLRNVATFEFLVSPEVPAGFVFIEANPRLQVEHTVTEEVTGIDLVAVQLRLAAGATLADVGLGVGAGAEVRGCAIQARVSAEVLAADGTARPGTGVVHAFDLPTGPGVRIDTATGAGAEIGTRYDPLLAKVIARAPSGGYPEALTRLRGALAELHIEGVPTNLGVLQALLELAEVAAGELHTRLVEDRLDELVAQATSAEAGVEEGAARRGFAGARVDAVDPLAVLHHGKLARHDAGPPPPPEVPSGTVMLAAPVQGTVVSLDVAVGDEVVAGQQVAVMESMKMEHVVAARQRAVVRAVVVAVGDTVYEGHPLAHVEVLDGGESEVVAQRRIDLDEIRPDLAEVLERHAVTLDAARPDAVAKRRATGQRTARENIDDLCDPGTFVEYGALAVAAQRRRRSLEDLIARTPADGMVAGIGSVNGDRFGPEASRCVLMSYDYTVLAGTQGTHNHRKKDRMFELAERWRLPVVLLTEGGGGRPGDTDALGVAGLDCLAFVYFAELSGLVPLVGINSGYCFAGNAALLGCCDVVIATKASNIGMGGPAMIEGGGLGVFRPDEVGPNDVQVPNGVIDIEVADEAEAVAVAKQYLAYFQGRIDEWECVDQRLARHLIPENRLRVYDIREVITTLADMGSVLELRRGFGRGMVTALARIEGRPVGIVANDPTHLGGAIDSDGADKAARFMQLCDAFDLPLLSLCDTPGMMVGPEVEKTALVRHCSRMFVTGANLTVPLVTVVLRKGYGLGAQAMAGGSFRAPLATIAWPTGEFGGMGLEGAVKLGYRNELAAVEDPVERRQLFEEMVARMYEHGKAVNMASYLEIDDVIDPADTRRTIVRLLDAVPPPTPRTAKKRPCVDTW